MSRPHTTRTRISTNDVSAKVSATGTSVDSSSQLLRLLHLASPALPIGAFHFSQGLEYAVESGWVNDERSAVAWISGIAGASFGTLDLPVLHRLHNAWLQSDDAGVARWNSFLIASRETEELRLEDRHLGSALLRVLAELQLQNELFPPGAPKNPAGVAHATAFAFAGARWSIEPMALMQTFAWSWVENQVLAAVKLVPLGQSAGQRILHALSGRLVALCVRAIDLVDGDIGVSSAMSAVASGRHETQYTRLFRS